MPSLRYLRLDGKVVPEERTKIVDQFNDDESIKVMLLTTRVGGLGLNLTGADTVVFLEHDWNPFSDLQAMDRVHRIGQTKVSCLHAKVPCIDGIVNVIPWQSPDMFIEPICILSVHRPSISTG